MKPTRRTQMLQIRRAHLYEEIKTMQNCIALLDKRIP